MLGKDCRILATGELGWVVKESGHLLELRLYSGGHMWCDFRDVEVVDIFSVD